MNTKKMYCITHEQMELVEFGEITGLPMHLVITGDIRNPDIDWCEGPFASCPPPEIEEWDVLFADEAGIQDLLDFMRQEEIGVI